MTEIRDEVLELIDEIDRAVAEEADAWSKKQAAKEKERAAKRGKPKPEGPQFTFWHLAQALSENEVGDARLVTELLRGRYCHDNLTDTPYAMNCTHWRQDTGRGHEAAMREVAREYAQAGRFFATKACEFEEAGETNKAKLYRKRADAYRGRASSLNSHRRSQNVWRVATAGDDSLGVDGQSWNEHPTLLPVANCIIDLETGKTYEDKPAHELLFNKASPVEWHGLNASAPLWEETIAKALCHDQELIEYFGYFTGWCAVGIQTKDFFALYGPGGSNAKSMLTEWMIWTLGGFADVIPVEFLLQEKYIRNTTGPDPTRMKLRGLRFACTSEAQKIHRFNPAKVKSVTGGDFMSARDLYSRDEIRFLLRCTWGLHTNFMPKAEGNDRAFYNRLRVIPFRGRFVDPDDPDETVDEARHIYPKRPRTEMDNLLRAEWPGILAYLVRWAKKALKLGDMPAPPPGVRAEVESYREDMDLIGQFLKECCTRDPEHKHQAKEYLEAIRSWLIKRRGVSEKQAEKEITFPKLNADFKTRVEMERDKGNVVTYQGYIIHDEWLDGSSGQQEAIDEVPF